MAYYPYMVRVDRNIGQNIVPVPLAKVSVVNDQGVGVGIFSTPGAIEGTSIPQPFETEEDGTKLIFVPPGRLRFIVAVDPQTTLEYWDVVPDNDNLLLPVMGERPTGDVDGVNTQFTVSTGVLGDRISLYVNGVRWTRVDLAATPLGKEFKVNVNVILTGDAPPVGAVIRADYIPIVPVAQD